MRKCTILSGDKMYNIKDEVKKNPNTPQDTLKELVNDKDSDVRSAVAAQDTLKELVNDKDERVRASVAENPNTSPEILKELAKGVRANNRNTPLDILEKLAKEVKVVAAKILTQIKKGLQKLTKEDEDNDVR